MRKVWTAAALLLLLCLACCLTAVSEEAKNLAPECRFRLSYGGTNSARMTDGKYTTYWTSKEDKRPYVMISSDTPMYALYLCFRTMPERYEIQETDETNVLKKKVSDIEWRTVREGDTRFYHTVVPLTGQTAVRILATPEKKGEMGFNEIFVFGEGELPDWVQQWEPTVEKADILFLSAHPDDELLFMGGAIPTYAGELGKRVLVTYLTYSNPSRRSEALNGLWHMGVRNYPVFGSFRDAWSGNLKDAYRRVKGGEEAVCSWLTEIFRKHRPDVVVTHDEKGEYGHGQHRMAADAAVKCFDLAADPDYSPESAGAYGAWQVRKLYLHLWGEESERTAFDWNVPLASMGGKTGLDLAEEAYALHMTQRGSGTKIHGKFYAFSVREFAGKFFPNNAFGLRCSMVGPDETHTDFLEHIDPEDHTGEEKR